MILFTVALTKFIKLMHCPQNTLGALFYSTSPFSWYCTVLPLCCYGKALDFMIKKH